MASPAPSDSAEQGEGDGGGHVRKWIRKKGPIALRSEVWKHFCELEGNKNTLKCDYCPKEFKYYSSTTNLIGHLKNVHHITLGKEKEDAATPSGSKDVKSQMSIQASMQKMADKDPLEKVLRHLTKSADKCRLRQVSLILSFFLGFISH